MSAATTALAEFLKNADRFAVVEDVTAKARWGDDGRDVSQVSCLCDPDHAAAEAARQLVYTRQPRARDSATVVGVVRDLEGETVALPYAGRLGVAGTINMLVLACKPDGAGRTILEGEVLL